MTSLPHPESLFIEGTGDPIFCTRHEPAPGGARDTAVILCPPFGWEEVCAYRSLRVWAERLAAAGYPALRLSLPSTGDSAGYPRESGRLAAWIAAVSDAAAWRLRTGNPSRLVAVGIGLGGMLAHLAAAGGAPINDLVLWGVPARGRALVRALRAFSQLEEALFFEGLAKPAALPEGELEAGGFLLSAETTAALEQTDLRRFELRAEPGRRALLLERDGLAPDAGLVESLKRSGLEVDIEPGEGFGDMTSHPQLATAPDAVIERVLGWIERGPAPEASFPPTPSAPHAATTPSPTPPAAAASVVLTAEHGIRETAVSIPSPFGALSGVLTQPAEDGEPGLTMVMLNAGAVRRIGPNRMWVEAARRWATLGVPTLRLDIEGVGEADGDEQLYRQDANLYQPKFLDQVRAGLDDLERRGVGDQFVLTGLCASANWAFHTALRDDRVSGVVLLNLRAIIWDQDLVPVRDLRALLTQPPSLARIRRAATAERIRDLARWLLAAPFRRLLVALGRRDRAAQAGSEADAQLRRLLDSGKRVLFLFSEHEPVYDELVRSGRIEWVEQAPNATLENIPVRDHTMRPMWAQGQLHEALDRALALEPAFPRPRVSP
jgi:dienelactone hydrolase